MTARPLNLQTFRHPRAVSKFSPLPLPRFNPEGRGFFNKEINMVNKTEYNRIYKDQTRIVVYVTPEVKGILAQEALDKGRSLSSICEPKLKEMANAIVERTT